MQEHPSGRGCAFENKLRAGAEARFMLRTYAARLKSGPVTRRGGWGNPDKQVPLLRSG